MLTHRRLPASLSLVSLDLPVRSAFETIVTLYQRAPQRFHVLIEVPGSGSDHSSDYSEHSASTQARSQTTNFPSNAANTNAARSSSPAIEAQNRLLWLEISPNRAIFTSQSKAGLSYRHMWECGTYGISRYWLNTPNDILRDDLGTNLNPNPNLNTSLNTSALNSAQAVNSGEEAPSLRMRLRNFTRSFELTGRDYPEHLRLEYELWSQQLKFGTYVLDLDIRV